MTEDAHEVLAARISELIVRERSLRNVPLADVIALYRNELSIAAPEHRELFKQRVEQQLTISAITRREEIGACEGLWRQTVELGFEDDVRRGSFACSVAALCIRNGWLELARAALDHAAELRDVPEPLLESIRGLRSKLA